MTTIFESDSDIDDDEFNDLIVMLAYSRCKRIIRSEKIISIFGGFLLI